jgi:photosystem II stability/assembly factor-like uncharacterized protein
VVAAQPFAAPAGPAEVQTLTVTQPFAVNAGDLLAFAGWGPYYPQTSNDAYYSDATYESSTDAGSYIATAPSGPPTQFSVGIYKDPLATYEYINDAAHMNQGRTYAIGVDVAVDCGTSSCTNGCIKFLGANNLVFSTCSCAEVHYPVSAIDTCCTNDPVTLTFDPPNGSCFPPGTYEVTCLATSACGDCNSTNFYVTVLHSTNPPVINCPSNIVVAGACPATLVYYEVTASSEYCSNVTVVATPPSGSFFGPGTTPVYCTATDCCGNTNFCSFSVTVVETPSCIAGESWAEQTNGLPSPGDWDSVASSADGTHLVAGTGVRGGGIYTSADGGATWTQRTSGLPSRTSWVSVAASSDGTHLAAVADPAGGSGGGEIYTSTDSGATWTQQSSGLPFTPAWRAIASSADGTHLVAAASYNGSNGGLYTSANGGASWTEQASGLPSPSSSVLFPVASSLDGTHLVTAEEGGIYTSTDSGTSWTIRTSGLPDSSPWSSVASSADGSHLVAVVDGAGIYTSANYGVTWNGPYGSSQNWSSVASSADGSHLVAVVDGGGIYTSANYGVTWNGPYASSQNWFSVASSLDGTHLVAVADAGVFTSVCTNVPCCVPPPTNLVLWLPFDETNGNTSANLASPGNPGTQVNHPAPWLGEYVANSLVFNGTNHVVVPNYPDIEMRTNGLTIDAWIYDMGDALLTPNQLAGIVTNSVILDKSANSPLGYSLWITPTNYEGDYPYGYVRFNMPGYKFIDTTSMATFQWHFIAVSMNQFANPPQGFFYVDGALTSTFTPPPLSLFNTNSLWLAAAPPGATMGTTIYDLAGPYAGGLDEVEIYSRALSTNELNAIYGAGTAGKCKPCCYLNKLTISRVTSPRLKSIGEAAARCSSQPL